MNTTTTNNTNGAPTIFGTIPGTGGIAGATRGVTEDAWWKVLEDAFEYFFNTYNADLGDVPTLEQARDIRLTAVRPALRARDALRGNGTNHGMPSNYDPERIQGWFENWHSYYPFVDQVAVARALGWSDASVPCRPRI